MANFNDPAYRVVETAQGAVQARCQPFIYGVALTFTAVPQGSSVTGQIQVDPGLPFILTEMHLEADNDLNTFNLGASSFLLCNITSGESQQLFANVAVPRSVMFGARDLLRVLPSEVQIRPSDTLTFTITNNTGAPLTTIVRPSLRGFKLVSPQNLSPR